MMIKMKKTLAAFWNCTEAGWGLKVWVGVSGGRDAVGCARYVHIIVLERAYRITPGIRRPIRVQRSGSWLPRLLESHLSSLTLTLLGCLFRQVHRQEEEPVRVLVRAEDIVGILGVAWG